MTDGEDFSMRDYRNFFTPNKGTDKNTPIFSKKETGKPIRVAFFSEIFENVSKNLIATNAEYVDLKNDVMGSIEPYGTKEKIILTVYEREKSTEFGRDSTIIGFRKYVRGCTVALLRNLWKKIVLFGSFFLIGLFIEIAIYAIPAVNQNLSMWFSKCLEIVANAFIWQLCGFLAFEFPGEIRMLRKYKQINEGITFDFKQFD